MKSNYHTKSKKNHYEMSYSGDLQEALNKAKEDLRRECENKEILHWEWLKKKAEAAIKAHRSKIEKLEAFIRVAERQLAKQTEEDEAQAETE